MATRRTAWGLALLLVLPAAGRGQSHDLSEVPKPGECFRVTVETAITGNLKVVNDGKEQLVPLNARNDHAILEKVLKSDKGVIQKSARWYEKALSRAVVGDEKVERTLREQRRLIVAQKFDDNHFCYAPAGPLTRVELDVVAEHFDTLCLTGLLPSGEVAVGDSWAVPSASVQALCLFEGLINHDLKANLREVASGQAIIEVAGKASGIELGAMVKLDVTATARFDLLKKRLVSVEWKQKDVRDLGPASPAAEMESTTTISRTLLNDEPKELTHAALVAVPQENEPQDLLKLLEHKDHKGRYGFLHTRDWHVVGQTENHLVLRLMERGDFIAQATITAWNKEDAGKHTSVEEFKRQIARTPSWELEEVAEAGEIPTDEGRYLYRFAARGELDGTKVVQNFVLLAGPNGDQCVITFTMKPANAGKIGTRDLALVNAIEFMKR